MIQQKIFYSKTTNGICLIKTGSKEEKNMVPAVSYLLP